MTVECVLHFECDNCDKVAYVPAAVDSELNHEHSCRSVGWLAAMVLTDEYDNVSVHLCPQCRERPPEWWKETWWRDFGDDPDQPMPPDPKMIGWIKNGGEWPGKED